MVCIFWLPLLIALVLGIFHGFGDQKIWHFPYSNEFYKNYPVNIGIEKKPSYLVEIPMLNTYAIAHSLIVHIICSLVGFCALYLILVSYNTKQLSEFVSKLGWQHFVLLLIATLGYTGLLPRLVWFFASKGEIHKP